MNNHKINARQLAFLLEISKKEATIKILRSLRLNGENYHERDYEFHPNILCDVDVLEKHLDIKLKFAIQDLYDNALKRPGFRKYLLLDYPSKALSSGKKLPKKVSLPVALRSLLSEESLKEIKYYWNKNFGVEGVLFRL